MTATPERDLETRVANIEHELANITEKLERLTQQPDANTFFGISTPVDCTDGSPNAAAISFT